MIKFSCQIEKGKNGYHGIFLHNYRGTKESTARFFSPSREELMKKMFIVLEELENEKAIIHG